MIYCNLLARYYWKVIMNMKEDRGVAVVGHNDVFSTSQEKDPALCADITINNKYNLEWLRYAIEDV